MLKKTYLIFCLILLLISCRSNNENIGGESFIKDYYSSDGTNIKHYKNFDFVSYGFEYKNYDVINLLPQIDEQVSLLLNDLVNKKILRLNDKHFNFKLSILDKNNTYEDFDGRSGVSYPYLRVALVQNIESYSSNEDLSFEDYDDFYTENIFHELGHIIFFGNTENYLVDEALAIFTSFIFMELDKPYGFKVNSIKEYYHDDFQLLLKKDNELFLNDKFFSSKDLLAFYFCFLYETEKYNDFVVICESENIETEMNKNSLEFIKWFNKN